MSGLVVCIEDHSGDTIGALPATVRGTCVEDRSGDTTEARSTTKALLLHTVPEPFVSWTYKNLFSRLASRSSFSTPFNFVLAHNQRFPPSETEGERVFGTTLGVAYWQPVGLHLILVSFHRV